MGTRFQTLKDWKLLVYYSTVYFTTASHSVIQFSKGNANTQIPNIIMLSDCFSPQYWESNILHKYLPITKNLSVFSLLENQRKPAKVTALELPQTAKHFVFQHKSVL